MKKIVLIFVLLFGVQTFAQKTIYVYNLSSTNFDIGDIKTKNSSSAYPIFTSNLSTGLITIPAGTTYILEATPSSTTKFPFYSPSSSPVIDFWRRQLTPGGPQSNLPSNLVANVYGASQILKRVKTQVGPNGSLGGGSLFPTAANGYSDSYTFGSTGIVTLNVIDATTGLPAPDGETYIFITD